MRISVRVLGHAREFFPEGKDSYQLEIDEGSTVEQVLRLLGVSPELVMAVLASGQRRDRSYVPADGEEIVLLSPPAGG